MILDGYLMFTLTPALGGDNPTTGTQSSTNTIDLGIVSGLPASAVNAGGARDIGIGDDPAMKILVQVVTTFLSGTSLQVGIQGAPDAGSNTPGSFTTMSTGAVVALASLIQGARLMDQDVPRPIPGQALPRYLRLTYITVGTFTAGNIIGTLVLDRHDLPEISNAVLSGYQAGITVAN